MAVDRCDGLSDLDAHRRSVDEGSDRHIKHAGSVPWYKRPSLTWILCMKSLSSIAAAITAGPRVEIYTELVCRGYTTAHHEANPFSSPTIAVTAPSIIPGNALSPIQAYFPSTVRPYLTALIPTTVAQLSIPPGTCSNDTGVQAEVARLAAVITIVGGILSCLTTGWWGGFLDRNGRTRTLGIIILGPLLSDFLTFAVFTFSDLLPGGYWFLVIASVMEGIMGVPSSIMAAETTYMRDVSQLHDLAKNFSLLIGIFYAGGAIGPVIGGFLNHQTGSVMAAFYAATVAHLAYAFLAWFAMPESIDGNTIDHAYGRYVNELASVSSDLGPFQRHAIIFIRSFWDSFPLNILTPKSASDSRRKDWNMTWLAISAGLINVIMGSGNSVYQYALYTFGWSSFDLGYFISASGISTVIFLTLVLPAIIRAWKRMIGGKRHVENFKQSVIFDLHLVRTSSIIFALGYALMGIAPTGLIFTLSSIISTFGYGFLPALQSVATILHTTLSGEEDTGRLFGALGVVYVLGGRIIGPAIYGTVYATTVSFFPATIMWVSVGCAMMVFLVSAFVRLPDHTSVQDIEQQDRELAQDDNSELDLLLERN